MLDREINSSLALHVLQEHHAKELFSVVDANRAHLRRWLPWLDDNQHEEDSAAFIRGRLKLAAESKCVTCGIWHEGSLCGVICHNDIKWSDQATELGYWLAEGKQGKGIMTNCCRAMIDHAFADYALNRIVIRSE